jgi:hypothetical protein
MIYQNPPSATEIPKIFDHLAPVYNRDKQRLKFRATSALEAKSY